MRGYLLDTSVISALAPGKPPVEHAVADWFRAASEALHLPSIAVAEIDQGICKLRRAGGTARADALSRWLDALVRRYGDRILPFDTPAARLAGQMSDAAHAAGLHPGFADVAIAAIAADRALTVLTRNQRHFAGLGVAQRDPWDPDPPVPH